MYDLSATPQAYLSYNNYSVYPTLANASGGAVITITLPDNTTSTPTVSNAVVGVYTCTGPTSLAGHYTVRYVSSGTNGATITDAYDVRPATSCALLSLAEARASLNFTSTIDDEELRTYIEIATDLIEARVGPILNRTVTEVIHGRRAVALSSVPVVSITSITADLTGGVALDPTGLFFDPNTGLMQRIDRGNFYDDTYTVVYVAGRGSVVANRFKMAAIHLIEHLWGGQRGAGIRPGQSTEGMEYAPGSAYTLPLNVLQDIETDTVRKMSGIA